VIERCPLGDFLDLNPFGRGWTDGLFYREKMRAIHRIAPPQLPGSARVLEIGGGRSRMAAMLYPDADVTTLDIDPSLAPDEPGDGRSRFVCGDATDLPFADASFDLVTQFDVLEHIEDDRRAAAEAKRVVRPGGWILVSTPSADWRYPYYGFMQRLCPPERALMDEWGHVRRGYRPDDLTHLFGRPADSRASFINAGTAFFHDVAFSRLSPRQRKLLYAAGALPTLVAYSLHGPETRGTEMAYAWHH
jgi:SAM-dependent methyltransferase